MGLKRRGTGRRPVLNLSDKQDTSRRTWQTKYQQICADHMIKNGVRAGSPMQAKEVRERSDAQQNCEPLSAADSSLGPTKNPLVGLLGQYNSDSDEDGEETEGNRKNSAEKDGGGLDAKVEDFMREIQALVPEPVKEEEKSETSQQEVEVSETDAWQQCYDHSSGYVYFWNVLTNEVSWEPPPGYDTEMLQPYSNLDTSQAIGGIPLTADYSHVPAVTPEPSVASQQMMPGVHMPHVMPGVPPASAAAASAYALKMPYGMPGVGHAHALVGMMHGYPAAPAHVHPHHQAYLQLKQKNTSKLKVPGLEDEEDDEDPYRPSLKVTAYASDIQAGAQQHLSLQSSSDSKASASNDAEDSYDGKIEMITSFSQDSDDEEELSSSSVEKARPPPKRRKGDAMSGPCQMPPANSHPMITQQAMDVAMAKSGSNEGSTSSSSVPKIMPSVVGSVSSNFSSLNAGTLPKEVASGVDNGKGVFKSQALQQHESSKDAALFPSAEPWAIERGLGERQDTAKGEGSVEADVLPAAKVPGAGREEKKQPPLSLIAAYGAEDSDDEDGERHKELKSMGTRTGDKSAKPLFPISVDEDEEMLDSRAFRRKRRIQVASTSKSRVGNLTAEKSSGTGEGKPGSMVENMAKLAHLWSDRESREEGGERRGLGFGGSGSKDHIAPMEEGQSSKGQRRKAGLIAFVKAETINLPPSSEQEDFEKKVDPSVEKLCQDLSDKVEFLQEGSKDNLSPVQEISIEMQALRNAYVLGALSSNYFGTWLQERWAALERTEEGAAPPGWVVQWCRDSKRYCYIEEATGKVEWIYPLMESEDIGREEDHDSSRGHSSVWSKQKEHLWEATNRMEAANKDDSKPVGLTNEAAVATAILHQNPPLPPPSLCSPPPPPPSTPPPPPPPPPPPSPPPPPPPPPPPATPPPPPPPPSEPLELAQPLPPGVESPLVPFTVPDPGCTVDMGEKDPTPPGEEVASSPSPPHWSPESPKAADWSRKSKKAVQVTIAPIVPPIMMPAVPMDIVTTAPAVLIPEVATFPATHHTIAKPPARADSLTAALDSFYSDIAMLNEPTVEASSEADAHRVAGPTSNARPSSPTPLASSHPSETKPKDSHGQDVPLTLMPMSEPAKPKKKKQPKLAPALSLKKKSVSTLVAKWQQVQEDVWREEMKESSGERP